MQLSTYDNFLTLRRLDESLLWQLAHQTAKEDTLLSPEHGHFLPWMVNRPPTYQGRAAAFAQYHAPNLYGSPTVENWTLTFAVFANGTLVGLQSIDATSFNLCRQVSSGSWLLPKFRSTGIGTKMRQLVLALAFDKLQAEYAKTAAVLANTASNQVSLKVGYQTNGIEIFPDFVAGELICAKLQKYLLTHKNWQTVRPSWADDIVYKNLTTFVSWLNET